ncbi:hypothetical protein NL676_029605 [Syzygium grande]|nr:hypothetical protein NL676_029605 [Syzygium grande]
MDDFSIKFFPTVQERKHHAKEDNYSKYDSQYIQLFASSLYLVALVSRSKRPVKWPGKSKNPSRKLLRRPTLPFLLIGISLRVFQQQFTGINALMFYALVLFQTVGFKNNASSSSSVITGILNVSSPLVSIYAVNRVGRRKLLLQACIQMFISCYWSNSISLFESRKLTRQKRGRDPGRACVVVHRTFAWPWCSLSWPMPSETFPAETRTTGFTFSMLCDMCAYIIFFTGWIFLMGLFVLFLLPETKEQRADGCDG